MNGVKLPVPNVAHFDLTAASPYAIQDMTKYFFTRRDFDPTFNGLNGFYVQDQIKAGRLQVLLGVRYEQFADILNYLKENQKTVKQNAIIPRLGLEFTINANQGLES